MRSARLFLLLLAGALLAGAPAAAKDDWLPITPEELALKDNPAQPGSEAMILYHEFSTDDTDRFSTGYYRVKIFTDVHPERFAEVQILYRKQLEYVDPVTGTIRRQDLEYVDSIKARTIRPDGTVVEFTGPIDDKVLYKKQGWPWCAQARNSSARCTVIFRVKTFTFPEAQAGSILEYKYTLRWGEDAFFVPEGTIEELLYVPTGIIQQRLYTRPRWIIQERLYTRLARFHFRPFLPRSYRQYQRRSSLRTYSKTPRALWTGYLPGGQTPQVDQYNNATLELTNIPGFPEEDFMPPEDQLKWRVEFFYTFADIQSADDFWQREGKELDKLAEDFIGQRKGIERAAAEIAPPTDPPETRLRKLYSRAQQIRNLTFAQARTEAEEKREPRKANKNAEDVLADGAGTSEGINRLFVALARAAGFPAGVVRVAERDEYVFQKNLLDSEQLSEEVAVVQVEGKDVYLDPGTPFCPFGVLTWQKSGVTGLRLDSNGGVFVKTPVPEPSQGLTERQADLTLDAGGTLAGTLKVSFHDHEALKRRGEQRDADEAARRKSLEDEVKKWLPPAAEVELQQMSGWETAEEPLWAEFRLRLTGFATVTGRRWLLPVSPFAAQWQGLFQQAQRTQPIQLEFPFEHSDEIVIHLPAGMQVESLPKPQERKSTLGEYELTLENAGGTLRVRRHLEIKGFAYGREYYSLFRIFFNGVRAGDAEQAALQMAEVSQRE